ncbi:hypothetical protein F53441_5604 [Fusarium austroafricanum]|uniref:Uncharacterized protein n=1 Tax=Fusarium austroafricanum TaxID=2364996 RepID=A0A8H4KKG9_9HYPO|nr:hypothetical protein F53441_5604 [Fusarium austroafricanum]
MASTTSNAEQEKLRQSFTLPASQAVAVSLCDEEALSATGESRGTAIWISDDETDTEDEDDDEGRNFGDSQSCTTPTTSIADHLEPAFKTAHKGTQFGLRFGTKRSAARIAPDQEFPP